MNLRLIEDPDAGEIEITVRCPRVNEEVQRLLALLRTCDWRLTGERDGQTHLLDPDQVLYADTADRRSFLYTAEGVYETPLRLYELEDRLGGEFFRASKSSLINFDHIRSLRPDLGGRLRVTLSNGEVMVVSRQYAAYIKQKLSL
ncbi:MAG: LytTR family transcriptional regulator [Oscillospiraceae bacterium]|nr:LytTR family transcriptional regulator [Oscillospiraceae bacterium]